MMSFGHIFTILLACFLLSGFQGLPYAEILPVDIEEENASSGVPGPEDFTPARVLEEECCAVTLDVRFSKAVFHVEEPVTVEIAATFPADTEDVLLDLPVLESGFFGFEEQEGHVECAGECLKVPLTRGEAWAERTCAVLNGKPCTTLLFRKTFIACIPGTLTIPESTLTIPVTEDDPESSPPLRDRFPDEYARGEWEAAEERLIVRSVPITLDVLPSPIENEPGAGAREMAGTGRVEAILQESPQQIEAKSEAPLQGEMDTPGKLKTGEGFPIHSASFPAEWVLLLVVLLSIRVLHRSRPEKVIHSGESRSDKAFSLFKRRIGLIRSSRFSDSRSFGHLQDALTEYVCDRLGLEGKTPDCLELRKLLDVHEGDPQLLAKLGEILSVCEQIKLGSDFRPDRSLDTLLSEAYQLVQDLDTTLQKGK